MATLAAEFPHFIFSSVVRDLGFIRDQELTFAPHLNSLSRACYYQLRQLRTVARSLTPTATATLVHSFVASRRLRLTIVAVSTPGLSRHILKNLGFLGFFKKPKKSEKLGF